jgi:ATP-binding cassette subfamily B protein
MKLAKVNAMFFPLMLLIIGASTILTIYFGGLQVFKGNVTPGNIAEFVIYVNMLTWPVTSIGWIASIIQQAEASQKRINEFLKAVPQIVDPGGAEEQVKGHITFRKASFTYKDTGIQAIKNISFNLLKGQKLAVLGRTGSGKSTLADLLLRMYDVDTGDILIDGCDIREMNLANLRNRIGYVPQDVFLFSDTISHNISFGKDEGHLEREKFYAKKAAVYEDIMALPDQFETHVGERGVTLSGGQKQRVSIARAFIRDPDIVILDDCLSAVDTRTENQILTYLNEALSDKTTIVITHRIYGMLQFDKIIVLDSGAIVEEGTHEELIEKGGFYAKMHEKQRLTEMENKAF